MKISQYHIKKSFLVGLVLLCKLSSFGQGRLVINEYMPWSGCSTTSEFIELMNFGPGPVNAGCYIVTNGKYSVTIPPNTILQPGDYYVLSGQDILPVSCGNIDSAVHVQLNWTTCNCSNTTIPTTGDGFMADGGNANEKVVLLDPNLNVVDAVTRSLPAAASVQITTAALSGGCSSKTFNLDAMSIDYEVLGMSTGKANSFARQVDGDCGWVKTPQQSAHATNNTGKTSSTTYNFNLTQTTDCSSGGSISIKVNASNYSTIFPMNYTLAYDLDKNFIFNFSDQYTYGTDNTAPTVDVNNLIAGRYNITVASVQGCDLHTFPFTILSCFGILPAQLLSFNAHQFSNNTYILNWQTATGENLDRIVLEQSNDGASFTGTATFATDTNIYKNYSYPLNSPAKFYRLVLYSKDGKTTISPVLNLYINHAVKVNKVWPNPSHSKLILDVYVPASTLLSYTVYTLQGTIAAQGKISAGAGSNQLPVSIENLPAGIYQLTAIFSGGDQQPISFRFVKQ